MTDQEVLTIAVAQHDRFRMLLSDPGSPYWPVARALAEGTPITSHAAPAGLRGALDRWWVESVHNHREERRRKDAEEMGLPYVKRCCGQT